MSDFSPALASRRVWLVAQDYLHDDYVIAGGQDYAIRPSARSQYEKIRRLIPDAETATLIASPLRRAQQTAARVVPNAVWEPAEQLAAQRFGDWEGKTWAQVRESDPGRCEAFWNEFARERPPGGESLSDVAERVEYFMVGLVNRLRWDRAVIVTHPEVIRVIVCQTLDIKLRHALRLSIEPLSLTQVSHTWLGWQLDSMNVTAQ